MIMNFFEKENCRGKARTAPWITLHLSAFGTRVLRDSGIFQRRTS